MFKVNDKIITLKEYPVIIHKKLKGTVYKIESDYIYFKTEDGHLKRFNKTGFAILTYY